MRMWGGNDRALRRVFSSPEQHQIKSSKGRRSLEIAATDEPIGGRSTSCAGEDVKPHSGRTGSGGMGSTGLLHTTRYTRYTASHARESPAPASWHPASVNARPACLAGDAQCPVS